MSNDSIPSIEKNVPKIETSGIKTPTGTESSIESIIVEVSNTPWIEQHSYMLDETVENVSWRRHP